MSKSILDNIKIGHSSLINSIYIYRHGKDEHEALDQRNAEGEVLAAVIQWAQMKAPETGTVHINFGEKKFELQVTPIVDDEVTNA